MTPRPNSEIYDAYTRAILPVYGTPMVALERGQGSHVWGVDGREYLDLLGGIAVNALGHAHPAWVEAVQKQTATLAHTSNFFTTEVQVALAERLLVLAKAPEGSRVFFSNSGTEAMEAAVKIARKTGRTRMIALEGAFHGRSTGALALTHKSALREPFMPLMGEVTFVPVNDEDALKTAMGSDVSAVFAEPIQGEAGVVDIEPDFLTAAQSLAHAHGALMVLDEVQTGIGRTGAWFAHQAHDYRPDVMALAKGLGGGLPVGATITYGADVTSLLGPKEHGTTFGGNPLAAAAALATLDVIEAEGLVERAAALGEILRNQLENLAGVAHVSGTGLLLGINLVEPRAPQVVAAALEAGFIINAPAPSVIRLAPALTVPQDSLSNFADWLGTHLENDSAPEHDSVLADAASRDRTTS